MKQILLFLVLIGSSNFAAAQGRAHSRRSIIKVMEKIANWQIDSIRNKGWRHAMDDWTNAVLYTGLVAYADATNAKNLYSFLKEGVGDKLHYEFTTDSNRYHADYYCVGQLYTSLYAKYKKPQMTAGLKKLADTLIQRPHTESLLWVNKVGRREWAWCDALYMAPPTLGMLAKVHKNSAYLDLCDRLWWKSTDYLYDRNEHLFYRDSRFFDKKEANGQKVFDSLI